MQRLLPQKFRSEAQSAPARERLFVRFLVKDRASARSFTRQFSPSHKLFFSQISLSRLPPSFVTQTFLLPNKPLMPYPRLRHTNFTLQIRTHVLFWQSIVMQHP